MFNPSLGSRKDFIGVSLCWAFKYRTTMWQVIAKSIQTFFEMRILHTFFNVDQERAWNVYVWLWYEKKMKKEHWHPFLLLLWLRMLKKIFCWAAWKVINGCVHSWMNFGSVYLHHDMSALWPKTEKVLINKRKCLKLFNTSTTISDIFHSKVAGNDRRTVYLSVNSK